MLCSCRKPSGRNYQMMDRWSEIVSRSTRSEVPLDRLEHLCYITNIPPHCRGARRDCNRICGGTTMGVTTPRGDDR